MSGTVVKRCGCKGTPSDASDFQDKQYGNGNRLMNLNQQKSAAVCTVCGKEHKS